MSARTLDLRKQTNNIHLRVILLSTTDDKHKLTSQVNPLMT
jgi:hypothetical protein